MSTFPQALFVSGSSIKVNTYESMESIERDPRGLLICWEPPDKKAKYIMAMDASEGVTGWTRATAIKGDHKIDNGAIEIFKVDGTYDLVFKSVPNPDGPGIIQIPEIDSSTNKQKRLYRDVQVAEFAAPVDAVEIAQIANVLGYIYCGDAEEQCELIWESWPGCGMLTTQELLRLNYSNLWHWEYLDSEVQQTKALGWHSSFKSQSLLWYRARRHMMNNQALIRSKHLLSEYANAEVDQVRMRARAGSGFHDDRFQAANMAFWAAHKWSYDVDRPEERVTESPIIDYQRYAPVLDSYESWSDWKTRATEDWD